MTTKLSYYLNNFKAYLRLNPTTKNDVIRELYTHLEDRSQELKESGLSEEEATETAAQFFGSPQLIARQIYEVYSQGSWRQAFFAALPHFLIALLFALRWWQHAAWLAIILIAVIGVVIYGWEHGKPAWLFPWLGYYLMPVIIAGVLLIYLPGSWAWFAAFVYIPLALLALISVVKQTARWDWLYVSLMLLPIPIALSWILGLGVGNSFLEYDKQLYGAAPWIALSFLTLAVTAVTFIRVKRRWVKAGALLTPEILILIVVAIASRSAIGFLGWLVLILLSLLLLISPAVLEQKTGETYNQAQQH